MWDRERQLKEVYPFIKSHIQQEASQFNDALLHFLDSYEKNGRALLEDLTSRFEHSVACFMEYFMLEKRDKIDKVLQCMLDFSVRHNVRLIYLIMLQKIVEKYVSDKAKKKKAKKEEDVIFSPEKKVN